MDERKSKFRGRVSDSGMMLVLAWLVLAATLIFAVSCGSSASDEISQSNAGGNRNSNAQSVNPNEQAGPNTLPNNGEGSTDANGNGVSASNRMMERIEKMRADAANKSGPVKSVPMSRPAPEDSVVTTELTDVARETRVFKKHPILLRVEKVHDGGQGSVKIILKDGRKFDLPGNSIYRIDQLSTTAILQLVGITPPPPKEPVTAKPNDQVKKQ